MAAEHTAFYTSPKPLDFSRSAKSSAQDGVILLAFAP